MYFILVSTMDRASKPEMKKIVPKFGGLIQLKILLSLAEAPQIVKKLSTLNAPTAKTVPSSSLLSYPLSPNYLSSV